MPPESPTPAPERPRPGRFGGPSSGHSALGAPIRALAAALAFLTRAPVPSGIVLDAADLTRAAVLFPLVGAALGALVGGAAGLLALALPSLLAATLAVAIETAVTGALHLDGLADSADGLAGRDRERALTIMRDHALGAYGACALVLDLLAKVVALAALSDRAGFFLVIGAYAVSRAAPLPLAAALPYARPGEGTGRLLAERLQPAGATVGIALAVAIAVAAGGLWAAPALACLLVVTGAAGLAARSRIGGVTGDVMGAAIELTATAALIVVAGARP